MHTRTAVPVSQEWVTLLAQAAIAVLIATSVVRRLERAARDQGLHYI